MRVVEVREALEDSGRPGEADALHGHAAQAGREAVEERELLRVVVLGVDERELAEGRSFDRGGVATARGQSGVPEKRCVPVEPDFQGTPAVDVWEGDVHAELNVVVICEVRRRPPRT